MRLRSRIVWFLVAGTVGFCVDGGILMALTAAGIDPRLGRLVSFVIALVGTWLINRARTFGDRAGPPSLREFLHYAAASVAAVVVNLSIFIALVTWGEPFRSWPILALAAATAVSMVLNFLSYMKVVFAPRN